MKRWFERQLARRSVRALIGFWAESSWVGLIPKALGGVGALLVLGFVGSGAVDHLFASRKASALDAIGGVHGALAPSASALASGSSSAALPPASSASASAPPGGDGSPAGSASSVAPASSKVVLNTATAAELDKLPGIGPSKAQKIVELRDKLGRFKRLEDLYRIKGIKRRFIERIRPLVVLDADAPAP